MDFWGICISVTIVILCLVCHHFQVDVAAEVTAALSEKAVGYVGYVLDDFPFENAVCLGFMEFLGEREGVR